MVTTPIDKFCNYYRKKEEFLRELNSIQNVEERRRRLLEELNCFMVNYNVTKASLAEYELFSGHRHAGLYALYLFQKTTGIDFNICEHFKMWYNRHGEQQRCEKIGRVRCLGDTRNCELK